MATDPLTANPYAYGIDNPLAYTDPSGHFIKAAINWVASNWQVIASVAICFVPVIGPAYMLASAVAGQDLITGTKLSGPERFLCALGGLALAAKAASTLAKAAGPMFKALGRFSSGLSKLFSGVKDGQLAAKVSEVTSAARASMGEGVFARALSGVGNTARELRSAVVNGGRRLLSSEQGAIRLGRTESGATRALDDLVPAYAGGKTRGVLDTGSELVPLISGKAGPASSLPMGTRGFNGLTKTHVEGHAAAIMRQRGLIDATLYLNQRPCNVVNGCFNMLPRMLPPGARLRVIAPDGFDRAFVGVPL